MLPTGTPVMTEPVVRRLLVDMEQPIARHWCAGDPFRTAFFNALSMSFPFGEQFFIDSVRKGFQALPPQQQAQPQPPTYTPPNYQQPPQQQ